MTQQQYWESEVKRMEEKFAATGDRADKIQLEASKLMLDPTCLGWDAATNEAMRLYGVFGGLPSDTDEVLA